MEVCLGSSSRRTKRASPGPGCTGGRAPADPHLNSPPTPHRHMHTLTSRPACHPASGPLGCAAGPRCPSVGPSSAPPSASPRSPGDRAALSPAESARDSWDAGLSGESSGLTTDLQGPARRDTDLGVCSWNLGLPPASSVALGQVTLAPSCCLPHHRLGRDVMGPERTWPGPGVETSRGTLPSPNSSLISGVTPTRTEIRGTGVGVEWWLTSQCLNKGSPTSNEAHWH